MILGISFAVLTAILRSGSYVFRKRGLEKVDHKVFMIIRLSVGVLVGGILLWSIGPGLAGLNIHMALPFMITGAITNVLTLTANTLAIHEIGASRTHALVSANPLVTAILAAAFLGEALTIYLLLGLLMIVLGGGALSYRVYRNQTSQKTKRPVFGYILVVYATVATGTITVLLKYGLNLGVTPIQGFFIRFATAVVVYGIYLMIIQPELNIKITYRSPNYLWASIFLTAGSILALLALQKLPATLVAGLKMTAPLFTVALAAITLKGIEKVDWKTFALAAVIVTGALLAIIG